MSLAAPTDPHRRRLLAAGGAALLGAVPLAASAKPRVVTVAIHDMAFQVASQTLRVGDAVDWINNDIFRHTATARNGGFDVDLAPQARARTVFHKPGTFAFYCRYHPGMEGTLVVTA